MYNATPEHIEVNKWKSVNFCLFNVIETQTLQRQL